jgi:hypothetical protein
VLNLFAKAWFVPLGIGGHIDHVIARDAVCHSSIGLKPLIFYEDLPYAGRVHRGIACEAAQKVSDKIGRKLYAKDISTSIPIAKKIAAISHYRSQVTVDTISDILGYHAVLGNPYVVERIWLDESAFRLF